jgi:hypothetical protein
MLHSAESNNGTSGQVIYKKMWDVVAQLAKATGRHQTEDAAVPGSNPAPPQSPERGQDIWLCVIQKQKSQQGRRHCSSKNSKKKFIKKSRERIARGTVWNMDTFFIGILSFYSTKLDGFVIVSCHYLIFFSAKLLLSKHIRECSKVLRSFLLGTKDMIKEFFFSKKTSCKKFSMKWVMWHIGWIDFWLFSIVKRNTV